MSCWNLIEFVNFPNQMMLMLTLGEKSFPRVFQFLISLCLFFSWCLCESDSQVFCLLTRLFHFSILFHFLLTEKICVAIILFCCYICIVILSWDIFVSASILLTLSKSISSYFFLFLGIVHGWNVEKTTLIKKFVRECLYQTGGPGLASKTEVVFIPFVSKIFHSARIDSKVFLLMNK